MGDALSIPHAARWSCRDRRAHREGVRYLRGAPVVCDRAAGYGLCQNLHIYRGAGG